MEFVKGLPSVYQRSVAPMTCKHVMSANMPRRRLFRERVQAVKPVRRARIRHTKSQLLPTLALRVEAVEPDDDAVLRPGELAALLGVSPTTLGRWASDGYLPCLRTVGGQRPFRWTEVRALIASVKHAEPVDLAEAPPACATKRR